jgi:hypothetical protein
MDQQKQIHVYICETYNLDHITVHIDQAIIEGGTSLIKTQVNSHAKNIDRPCWRLKKYYNVRAWSALLNFKQRMSDRLPGVETGGGGTNGGGGEKGGEPGQGWPVTGPQRSKLLAKLKGKRKNFRSAFKSIPLRAGNALMIIKPDGSEQWEGTIIWNHSREAVVWNIPVFQNANAKIYFCITRFLKERLLLET